MTEPYYNASLHGNGFEGLINYANVLVDGWFVNAFLITMFIISVYVLSKSEWKISGVLSFSFFLCFLTAIIFKIFTAVNEMVIFMIGIGLAGSIFWSIISRDS
jgi:hypothetical protein